MSGKRRSDGKRKNLRITKSRIIFYMKSSSNTTTIHHHYTIVVIIIIIQPGRATTVEMWRNCCVHLSVYIVAMHSLVGGWAFRIGCIITFKLLLLLRLLLVELLLLLLLLHNNLTERSTRETYSSSSSPLKEGGSAEGVEGIILWSCTYDTERIPMCPMLYYVAEILLYSASCTTWMGDVCGPRPEQIGANQAQYKHQNSMWIRKYLGNDSQCRSVRCGKDPEMANK